MAQHSDKLKLALTFKDVRDQCYPTKYRITDKDMKFAGNFIDRNPDWTPDEVVEHAKVFLRTNGIFEEQRHQFCDFINNFGRFDSPKVKPKSMNNSGQYTCEYCKKSMPENEQFGHFDTCDKIPKASMETIQEVKNAITELGQKWKS